MLAATLLYWLKNGRQVLDLPIFEEGPGTVKPRYCMASRGPGMAGAQSRALVRRRGEFHTLLMAQSRDELLEGWNARQPMLRGCDHDGCAEEGLYRAPRSRERLGLADSYFWFCLEHVRAYNAAWNYYAGMSEGEIERELRHDSVWQRPTWPLGRRMGGRVWRDPLHLYTEPPASGPQSRSRTRVLSDEEKALLVFELEPPFEIATLKARYKLLVKRHHPDANGGDKAAEERLKIITQAYALLKNRFFS